MTGVGQLPCSDTPSPIPRLTRRPRVPQPALKPLGTAAWVPQKVRAQSTLVEENDRLIQGIGGPLPRSTRSHPAGHPLLSCTSTRTPTTYPRHTAASGRLLSGLRTGKSSLALRGGAGVTHVPLTLPAPALGSSFNGAFNLGQG